MWFPPKRKQISGAEYQECWALPHFLGLEIAHACEFAVCLWKRALILLEVWSVALNEHRDPPLSLKTRSCISLYSIGLDVNHCCLRVCDCVCATTLQRKRPRSFLSGKQRQTNLLYFPSCLTSYHPPPKTGPFALTLTRTERCLSHRGGWDYRRALIDSLRGDEQEKWQW